MSKRNEILELLKKEELTATEISEKTGYSIDIIRTYLSQFIKDKKAVVVDPTKGWHKKYRAIEEPIELLKQLINFMSNKCEVKGEVSEIDSNLFKQIEQVIK